MSGSPLEPHERETYATDPGPEVDDPLAREPRDQPGVGAVAGAPPWVLIAVVVTVIFLVLLVAWFVWPTVGR